MARKRVSVVGLGKLGLCLSALFADSGLKVIGIDNNEKVIDAANSGKPLIEEPGLLPLLKRSRGKIKFVTNYSEAIQDSDVTFLVLPTPSIRNGEFDLNFLKIALKRLANILKDNPKDYHTFVIVSTVSPGSIGSQLAPLIERCSRRKLNKGFGLCYNPAFVALGSVIRDFKGPDFDLIGQSDEKTGQIIENIKRKLYIKTSQFARMSIISSEITKLSLNSFVTMKISFINTLADICLNVPGADIDQIAKALGYDKRISPFYLKAGATFGGPCFPRDNKAFAAFARKHNVSPVLALATEKINKEHEVIIIRKVFDNIPVGCDTVSVVGLSYKPFTSLIDGSIAIAIIKSCLIKKLKVVVFDSKAMENTSILFGPKIKYATSLDECLKASNFWIVTSDAQEYNVINKRPIKKPTTIVDCWGSLMIPSSMFIKYVVPVNPKKNKILIP